MSRTNNILIQLELTLNSYVCQTGLHIGDDMFW